MMEISDKAHYEPERFLLPTPGDVGSYADFDSVAFRWREHFGLRFYAFSIIQSSMVLVSVEKLTPTFTTFLSDVAYWRA